MQILFDKIIPVQVFQTSMYRILNFKLKYFQRTIHLIIKC